MMTKRVMGKAAFFHVADESGTIQAYVRRDDLPEGEYNTVVQEALDTGDWVGIEGVLFRTRMGEVTVQVERLVLLAKSVRPLPVEKEAVDEETGEARTFNEVTDPEFRYRQRYVDLALHPDVRRRLPAARARRAHAPRRARPARLRRDRDAGACSRSTAAPRRGRSRRTTTRSTCRSFSASRTSCTSSACSSAASRASTRSPRTSATRACRASTTPSSRCSNSTSPSATTSG